MFYVVTERCDDMNKKIYYVYEWYIVETGEVFYVGEGKNKRCKTVRKGDRTQEFLDIYHSNKCNYRILFNELTQQEAWDLEIETIAKYKELGYPLVNVSTGGKCGLDGVDRAR